MSGASIGSASLRFTGAFEREAEGRGVWLADDHVAHLVMSGDMHGPQAHTDWNLLLVEDEDDDERDIYFVQLTVFEVGDDEITERSYTLSDGDDLDFVAGAYVLDNQLRGEDGTVHIKGRAEVPRWPTAPDVDRVTTEMTAAFSDIRPFAYVAHGSVEPMVKDTALLSVVRPRDEGHDVAESLRDRLPDHWTAWVGEDEPGPDEVEDDNSPPTFAVGKNGLPVPFDKHPVQVVCSPAGLEQILAYSRFNPPGVGFGAGAMLPILERWRQSFEFTIVEACHDSIVLQLDTEPPDRRALAAEICELCPDVVDYFLEDAPSGTDPEDAVIRRIKDLGDIELWWD